MTAQSLERLHNNKEFVELVMDLLKLREDAIRDLAGATTERVQQIAGKLVLLDEILVMVHHRDLLEKWNRIEG